MYSKKCNSRILLFEVEEHDGSYGIPALVYQTGDNHHVTPRTIGDESDSVTENSFEKLEDSDSPTSIKFKYDESGFLIKV